MGRKKNKAISTETKLNKYANYLTATCILLLGLFLAFFPIYINPESILFGFKDIMSTCGQILVAFAAGSLLLEWFGYVNYTRKRMCEILSDNEVLNVLNTKRKRELKSAILHNLYMPNKTLEENNIATIVDNEMDTVLKGYYYEEFISYVDASIIFSDNKEKLIKKDIRITFNAKSVKGEKCVLDSLISTYLDPIKDKDIKPLTLKKLMINDTNMTDTFKDKIVDKANEGDLKDTYTRRYRLDKDIDGFKEAMTFTDNIFIDMEYTTIVKIDDLVYSHQIDKACKHFCLHFNVNPDEFDLMVQGFGFMSLGRGQRQRTIRTKSGYMLRFLDWILPGDGAIIVLREKEKNEK